MLSDIDWCDHTITAGIYGCDPISKGCDLCWAARLASTRHRHLPKYAGLAADGKFNGTVRIVPEEADEPLRMRKPRGRIFVASKADLFHHLVPPEHVARLFAAMIAAPQHTYQLLTKRGPRMEKMLRSTAFWQLVSNRLGELWRTPPPAPLTVVPRHIWVGVSVEDQKAAQRRIAPLVRTPALTRWVSVEPLIGPVDLDPWIWGDRCPDRQCGDSTWDHECRLGGQRLHWVVVGGETALRAGTARLMHPDWARTLRDQCTAAGVPFFFKQWGSWAPPDQFDSIGYDDVAWDQNAALTMWPDGRQRAGACGGFNDRSELLWPVGKRAAGHRLDDDTWQEFPR